MSLFSRRSQFLKYFRPKVPAFTLGIGYGSGMKPQLGYHYQADTETNKSEIQAEDPETQTFQHPMMDMMLVSENTEIFNEQNFDLDNQNPGMMITLLRKCGLNLYNFLQTSYFPLIYYLNEDDGSYRFKYGLLHSDDFMDDLEIMNYFTLAGRLQKPVHFFDYTTEEELNSVDLFNAKGHYFFDRSEILQSIGNNIPW